MINRSAGVLMHISSLSSPYGIGTLGASAYEFVDFLKESGIKYWQILPICPPSVGDSPYSAFSTFAGNPYFIDLDILNEEGLLEKDEYINIKWGKKADQVDFKALAKHRLKVLRNALKRFDFTNNEYVEFKEENADWLDNYAKFMTLKEVQKNKAWYEWEGDLKDPNSELTKETINKYIDTYNFYSMLQYLFFKQWFDLLNYAHDNGIKLIGDLPIYVALDSSDVWADKRLFKIGKNYLPKEVSGCPPDCFAIDGQKWGNPLYDWKYHKKTNYEWWIKRIEHHCIIHDVLRIDHFRGFEAYYCIPFDGLAKDGHWEKGPGMNLFNALKNKCGNLELIAEDLGFITPSLQELLTKSGYPGMKILEFAFDSRDSSSSLYIPHKYNENCIAYTGTHDNDTLMGWQKTAYEGDVNYAKEYAGNHNVKEFNWSMMKLVWQSKSNLAIVQAQDLLGLDEKSRMNTPSTVEGNWSWRAKKDVFTYDLARKIALNMHIYER